MADQRIDSLIAYARRFIGVPYVYGGNGPHIFDCSGLACTILKKSGNIRVSEDLSAQEIYDRLVKQGGTIVDLGKRVGYPVGSFIFYDGGSPKISHVAFMVDTFSVLEAGGGSSTTNSVEKARDLGACVREVFWQHRKDVRAIVFPKFGWQL